jgi:hypothetical protein
MELIPFVNEQEQSACKEVEREFRSPISRLCSVT